MLFTQFNANGEIKFGVVHFFFRIQLENNGPFTTLAMISLYSPPHPTLLAQSEGTLLSCTYLATFLVINAVDIRQVIAMVPHTVNGQQRYFMFEQPGQDMTNLGGFVIGFDESDDNDNDNSD